MIVWVREPKRRRLIKIEPGFEPQAKHKSTTQLKAMEQGGALSDNSVYPTRVMLSSCFNLPNLGPNMTFVLRPYCTQVLLKFTNLEDAYLSLRAFDEVCALMHILTYLLILL